MNKYIREVKVNKESLNSLRERLEIENLSESLYFPKYFEIETIRGCNANCEMCPTKEWKGKGRMSENLFSKVAKEISTYSDWVNTVCLSRNGEPLLDSNLERKVRLLKDYDISNVNFSTNASLLNKKRAISIIDSGLDDIKFSIDGLTKKTFEGIRKGLYFEKVRENIIDFINIRNSNGEKPRVHIRMVLQEENYKEEIGWKDFWKSKVLESDIVSSKQIHLWGNQLNSSQKVFPKKNEYSQIPCISVWSTMIIHFDGKVPLCGCDYNNKFLMGNLNSLNIKDIWMSDKFDKMRDLHSYGRRDEISFCKECNIWDLNIKKEYKNE